MKTIKLWQNKNLVLATLSLAACLALGSAALAQSAPAPYFTADSDNFLAGQEKVFNLTLGNSSPGAADWQALAQTITFVNGKNYISSLKYLDPANGQRVSVAYKYKGSDVVATFGPKNFNLAANGQLTSTLSVTFSKNTTSSQRVYATVIKYDGGQTIGSNTLFFVPQAAGQVLGTSTFNFTRNLSLGMSGNDVTELQKALALNGVYRGPITGYFGQLTFSAVKAFQSKNGIKQTGVVAEQTRIMLNNQTAQ